ncbi:hypothetical protein XB05_13780 [Xanthomonas arboricola]|uniref:response regulator n=1 Tax=Xanthomonas arboricola TaxID=56448 RepID=UPI00061A1055|nr:response regulator [Xanthomonas arboricola]AKC79707.1 hypothetical protein XB05_13780 [Xanthomonas arboricola]
MKIKNERLILVVEDDQLFLMLAEIFLQESGYDVLTAENSAKALEHLESSSKISAIVSDIQMPGVLDGYGLITYLRACDVRIPAILTSGGVVPKTLPTDTQFLSKPYSNHALLSALQRMLAA